MASRLGISYGILLVWVMLAHFGVQGSSRLSEKQGLAPHKHAIKTIKTEYGDVYDCVDFYKQPGLDHPLFKNHSYHPEMRPTFIPKEIALERDDNSRALDSIKLKGGGCPIGTVPIRRTGKLDDNNLLVSQLHAAKSMKNPDGLLDRPGVYFAIAQTKNSPEKVYYGVGAYLANFNPKIVEDPQYSSAEIIIMDGTDSITAGWTVNPSVYKDNRTRFFVYTTVNDKPCFNTRCGFVSTSQDIPPDFVVYPISQRGGSVYSTKTSVYKDPEKGIWWLGVNGNAIGFWPNTLFSSLGVSGSYVACGGEVYYPQRHPGAVGPEMGAGVFPVHQPLVDNAFCSWFNVMNEKGEISAKVDDTEEFANNPDSYKVMDNGYRDPIYGHVVEFGGPLHP